MPNVVSKDGTRIAYDSSGTGPTVILVDGALSYRESFGSRPLAALLSDTFRTIAYDRRGRGESGDTLPYTVEREIDDIAALMDVAEGRACLFGFSSGAALILKAAAALGDRVAKIAIYEPPYSLGDDAPDEFAAYQAQMDALLNANQRDEAVSFFLQDMMPPDQLNGTKQSRDWAFMTSVAHTLAYENKVMGNGSPPFDEVRAITVPTLLMDGAETLPFMRDTVNALAQAMPHAQRQTIEGQNHRPEPEAIAPVLREFFAG